MCAQTPDCTCSQLVDSVMAMIDYSVFIDLISVDYYELAVETFDHPFFGFVIF